jgi:glycosyltransferase involved in cell wall biosynthesis
MRLLGLIPEPPFDPKSWSGSAANFFNALRAGESLADAVHIRLSPVREGFEKARVASWPLERWKERYHASVPRFRALTAIAGDELERFRDISGVIQIGAWFSAGSVTSLPCFSYHDGNAALWYRHYDRGLLSEPRRHDHLQWERTVYSRLRGLFVMSSWLASSFVNDFGVAAERLHVVGAGINTGKLPVVPTRDFSMPRFLFVGKDFARKGGRFLLKAFSSLKNTIPHAELIIVGPLGTIDQPGVTCTGFLSKANPEHVTRLNELFLSATAVILPSIYEPFGISLLEGMAYGLPCVAADRCAMPEIVRDGESGLIVPAEDSATLTHAMLELARNPVEAAAMGRAGRLRVESDFTWDAVAGKINTILSDSYGLR